MAGQPAALYEPQRRALNKSRIFERGSGGMPYYHSAGDHDSGSHCGSGLTSSERSICARHPASSIERSGSSASRLPNRELLSRHHERLRAPEPGQSAAAPDLFSGRLCREPLTVSSDSGRWRRGWRRVLWNAGTESPALHWVGNVGARAR